MSVAKISACGSSRQAAKTLLPLPDPISRTRKGATRSIAREREAAIEQVDEIETFEVALMVGFGILHELARDVDRRPLPMNEHGAVAKHADARREERLVAAFVGGRERTSRRPDVDPGAPQPA